MRLPGLRSDSLPRIAQRDGTALMPEPEHEPNCDRTSGNSGERPEVPMPPTPAVKLFAYVALSWEQPREAASWEPSLQRTTQAALHAWGSGLTLPRFASSPAGQVQRLYNSATATSV